MKRFTPVSGLILCLSLSILPGQSSSQTQESRSVQESDEQRIRQLEQEQQQRVDEQRQRTMEHQEEFWQNFHERQKQRLQEDWPNLSEQERQRRQESLRKSEKQHQQMVQRQQDFWQRNAEQRKQNFQRMEEQRRKHEEEQRAIKKAAGEYSEEVWQEILGATPEQWKAIKPQLEKIHQLKDGPRVDVSVYWLSGSTRYEEASLVESPDGARSIAKASGWFSVTSGAGSASESYARSGADGKNRDLPIEGGHYSSHYGYLTSGQYSATTTTGAGPDDPNRPAEGRHVLRMGNEPRRAVARGTIKFGMQIPGPIKKQVGDIDLGWQWERPSLDRSPEALSEGEKACERLLDAFEENEPDPEQVRQRIEALRKVRQQRRTELEETRRQLLALLTPAQEAKLILMGYLE
jgi:hypothetical protein